jgi:hypothetical protein
MHSGNRDYEGYNVVEAETSFYLSRDRVNDVFQGGADELLVLPPDSASRTDHPAGPVART